MTDDEIKILGKSTALSNYFLTEIGRITAHFALLERDVVALIHCLIGIGENSARVITSELSFRALQQLASSLVKEIIPERSEDLKEILKRVGKAEEKRNYISHSLWGMSGSKNIHGEYTAVRSKFSAKQSKGLHFSREELTVGDLYAIAAEISIAAHDVEMFSSSIKHESRQRREKS